MVHTSVPSKMLLPNMFCWRRNKWEKDVEWGCCLHKTTISRDRLSSHSDPCSRQAGRQRSVKRGPNDHKLNGPAPFTGSQGMREEGICLHSAYCMYTCSSRVRSTNTKLRAVDATAAAPPSTSRARQSVASKLFFTLAVFVWTECGRGGPACGERGKRRAGWRKCNMYMDGYVVCIGGGKKRHSIKRIMNSVCWSALPAECSPVRPSQQTASANVVV